MRKTGKIQWWKQGASVLLVLMAGILYSCSRQSAGEELGLWEETASGPADGSTVQTESASPAFLYVHVCGAVKVPGVYALAAGSRYQDAVEAAGGFREDAEETFLNLASPLTDGEQLVVPTVEEAASREASRAQAEQEDGRVDLNQAGKEELMTLPGIGEVKAEAILAYREEHGPFSTVEELMQVSGIKENTFAQIKERIKVGISNGE